MNQIGEQTQSKTTELPGKTVSASRITLAQLMQPEHANNLGNVGPQNVGREGDKVDPPGDPQPCGAGEWSDGRFDQYLHVPRRYRLDWSACFMAGKVKRLIARHRWGFNLIHGQSIFPSALAAFLLSQHYKVPFVITLRDDLTHLEGMLDREVERFFGHSEALRPQGQSPHIERLHRDRETVSSCAEQVSFRHTTVFEEDVRGMRTANPHLLFRRTGPESALWGFTEYFQEQPSLQAPFYQGGTHRGSTNGSWVWINTGARYIASVTPPSGQIPLLRLITTKQVLVEQPPAVLFNLNAYPSQGELLAVTALYATGQDSIEQRPAQLERFLPVEAVPGQNPPNRPIFASPQGSPEQPFPVLFRPYLSNPAVVDSPPIGPTKVTLPQVELDQRQSVLFKPQAPNAPVGTPPPLHSSTFYGTVQEPGYQPSWFSATNVAVFEFVATAQRMFLGPQGEIVEEVKKHGHGIRDLNWRDIATVVPLLIFIFWIGLYPKPFFALMAPAVDKLVAALQSAALVMH